MIVVVVVCIATCGICSPFELITCRLGCSTRLQEFKSELVEDVIDLTRLLSQSAEAGCTVRGITSHVAMALQANWFSVQHTIIELTNVTHVALHKA